MMLKDGEKLEIGGEEGIICFSAKVYDGNYICVAFENNNPRFEIYEYKYENDKLLVGKVEDKDEMNEVLKVFIQEGINEFGIPKSLEKGFAQLIEQMEEEK